MKKLNWKLLVILAIALVLIFTMVACNKDEPDTVVESYTAMNALTDVLTAADVTVKTLTGNTGTVALDVNASIESDLKIVDKTSNSTLIDWSGTNAIKYGARIAGNFDKDNSANDQILVEVTKDAGDILGVYSSTNQVYIKDNFTTGTEQKLKITGVQALNYNKYLSMIPGVFSGIDLSALGSAGLAGLANSLGSFESILGDIIVAEKKEEGTTKTVSLKVVILQETDATGKTLSGISSALPLVGSILGEGTTLSSIVDLIAPYVLGGTFAEFKAGTVTKAPTLTANISIDTVTGGISGLSINVDANALADNGVSGTIKINLSNLVVSKTLNTALLPADLSSYKEGALSVTADLDVTNNADLKLRATFEVSPSLVDENMKVSLKAFKTGETTPVDLAATYTQVGDQWGICFDIGELYDVAGAANITKMSNTKWFYPFEIGSFLTNLITKQRTFVFYNEADQGVYNNEDMVFWSNREYTDFFVAEAASFNSGAALTSLNAAIRDVQDYYAAIYGGVYSDYTVTLRNGDGTLAWDGTEGSLTTEKASLGFNKELFAMVSNASAVVEAGGKLGRNITTYYPVTFTVGSTEKVVYVKGGQAVPSGYIPSYAADANTYADGWQIAGTTAKADMTAVVNGAVSYEPHMTSTDGKTQVTFYAYNFDSNQYVEQSKQWFTLDAEGTTYSMAAGNVVPEVPSVYGMTGIWMTGSEAAPSSADRNIRGKVYAVEFKADSTYTVGAKSASAVYAVYSKNTAAFTADVGYAGESTDASKQFEKKFGRDGSGITIDSIVEAGDPSAVGSNAVSAIMGNLSSYIDVLTTKSISLQLIADTAGAISPYLSTNALFSARIRDILSPLQNFERGSEEVAFPIVMPSLTYGEGTGAVTVSEASVGAIQEGTGYTTTGSFELKNSVSDLAALFATRNHNTAVYVTYWRFVGMYGGLTVADTTPYVASSAAADKAASLATYAWTATQITAYNNATGAVAKATKFAANEKASYANKVAATKAKLAADIAKSESDALAFIGGYLGSAAVAGYDTVEEFFFGVDGDDPIVLSFELNSATSTANMGLSLTLKRTKNNVTLATADASVFFSLASGITPPTTDGTTAYDWSTAQDISAKLIVDTEYDFVLYDSMALRNAGSTDGTVAGVTTKAEILDTEYDAIRTAMFNTYDDVTGSFTYNSKTVYVGGETSHIVSALVYELKQISLAMGA